MGIYYFIVLIFGVQNEMPQKYVSVVNSSRHGKTSTSICE